MSADALIVATTTMQKAEYMKYSHHSLYHVFAGRAVLFFFHGLPPTIVRVSLATKHDAPPPEIWITFFIIFAAYNNYYMADYAET